MSASSIGRESKTQRTFFALPNKGFGSLFPKPERFERELDFYMHFQAIKRCLCDLKKAGKF
ncbi:hypothetical protein EBU99_12090 [bacterium]|nr:hypothetical protein [bacterium]